MANKSVNNVSIEHVNGIYQDAVANFYKLDAMEYENEYARAMALKPYLDLINSLDTKFREGKMEGKIEGKMEEKLEIAKTMLTKGFTIETVIKITGLTKEVILL
jgi:predicted transposase/invertase (TIGR01784 family)